MTRSLVEFAGATLAQPKAYRSIHPLTDDSLQISLPKKRIAFAQHSTQDYGVLMDLILPIPMQSTLENVAFN